MSLTARSRLSCLKHKQKRLQRKLENQNGTSNSALTSQQDSQPTKEPECESSAKEKAWKKYLHAKTIYEQTREIEHWQYMEKCLTDYENLQLYV